MRSPRLTQPVLASAIASALFVGSSSCGQAQGRARAERVAMHAQLIGGPRGLGEVGDWLIQNDRVRFVIQDKGFSRGFGVYGGSLIDADLQRPEQGTGSSTGGLGKDNFGELFPIFFFKTLEPRDVFDPNTGDELEAVAVENDGSDGNAAVVVVRGTGADFIALTEQVNEIILDDPRDNPALEFETRYILEPDAQYVEIETRAQNIAFPPRDLSFSQTVAGAELPRPFGDVMLAGAGNQAFVPTEAGFDLRYRLEAQYSTGHVQLPALPGIVAEFVATKSPDVSYGILADAPANPENNFAFANRATFPEATTHSVHVPFIAGPFSGVFSALPPSTLAANDGVPGGDDEFVYRRKLIVGTGDIASISDVVYDALGYETGTLTGRVTEELTRNLVRGAETIVVDSKGAKVTEAGSDASGRFRARLRPGAYTCVTRVDDRVITKPIAFTIAAGHETFVDVSVAAAAQVVVNIVEKGVGLVPAKATLVGTTPPAHVGEDTRQWLFDLSLGESWHFSDLIADVADKPDTLRYIEALDYATDGVVHLTARPGHYKVIAGRGLEYTRSEADIDVVAGETRYVTLEIERTVDTSQYISADFHLHSGYSLDSAEPIDARLRSYVGEGLEIAVSTDHNFVVDYQPTLQAMGLTRWMNSLVGLELTTIDRGHFNGFPLERQKGAVVDEKGDAVGIASRTYGSFEWALHTPQEIFDGIRNLGALDKGGKKHAIVQVNHPRDALLGYFEQYAVNPDTMEAEGLRGLLGPRQSTHPEFAKESFSLDFDALEVFNSKRFELLHTLRVPDDVTIDPRLRQHRARPPAVRVPGGPRGLHMHTSRCRRGRRRRQVRRHGRRRIPRCRRGLVQAPRVGPPHGWHFELR